jgi:hypothetical protein
VQAELLEYVLGVPLGRSATDVKQFGDLVVRSSCCEESSYFKLAVRQARAMMYCFAREKAFLLMR